MNGGVLMRPHRPRLLLIDDDPTFGRIMGQTADNLNVDLDFVESVDCIGFIHGMADYDIIIVDHHLNHISGMEVATYVPAFYAEKTVVLISSSNLVQEGGLELPPFISAFVHKDEGCYRVLKQALASHSS
jgi:CheY-like chemotaxis protein